MGDHLDLSLRKQVHIGVITFFIELLMSYDILDLVADIFITGQYLFDGQEQFVDSWLAPKTPVALESPTRALSGLWALWVPPEFQTLGSS